MIFILGEAWGADEERARSPFVGAAGWELNRMLGEAGIIRADCHLSNVFNFHPPANDLSFLCGEKSEAIAGYPKLLKGNQKDYNYYTGDYVREEYTTELERLADELLEVDPNLILALGNTALWAVAGKTNISKLRGTTLLSTHTASGFKVLPTYHPSAVNRQWSLRPIVIIDLEKALKESEFPEIRRPKREIWIEPTLEDIYDFHARFIEPQCRGTGRPLSIDIETVGREITCIGFAPSPALAIVIPFHDPRRMGRSYWPTKTLELSVWNYIRQVLEDPLYLKLFQNGLYDISFTFRSYGIKVAGADEDTMLLHHALQPESIKDLGFLGATYTDEGAWKQMRTHKTTIKRED